jgi:hypothetical protein
MGRHARGLTGREIKFTDGVAGGKSLSAAARSAGYAESTARKKAHEIMRRPLVQSALTVALARQGGTMELIVRPILDALQANLVISTHAGMIVTDSPDHRLRLDAASLAIRLLGGLPRASELPQQPPPSLIVNISQQCPTEGLTVGESDGKRADEMLDLNIRLRDDDV